MSDPVILYGTQSNGNTLPVQVDQYGRLVAEGLPGSEGPPGPPGADGSNGQPGGSFPLPPDPYEGALLGWLNNELAWIGTPPIPVPEGVFGPITGWDSSGKVITVDGNIPSQVASGVYVWQCDAQGNYITDGWNTSDTWSNFLTPDSNWLNGGVSAIKAFDGDYDSYADSSGGGWTFDCSSHEWGSGSHDIELVSGGATQMLVNGQSMTAQGSSGAITYTATVSGNIETIQALGNGCSLYYIKIDGEKLVDHTESLNLRVSQALGNELTGLPNHAVDFTLGAYLRVPQQRIAPWVYRGDDGLLRKVITSMTIDNLRSS